MKTILSLNATEAKIYLLNEKNYCTIDLPQYFTFQKLLITLSGKPDVDSLSSSCLKNASSCDDCNYTLYNNKDGQFAWRPLQLINPVLYVSLVHKITITENWTIIIDRFKEFSANPKIECCSMPPIEDDLSSAKSDAILNWWTRVEQESIKLAMRFNYMLCTDITDCYGSVYTHTISWALRGKEEAKEHRLDSHIGNFIDKRIQSMSYGQTNGIPQGSELMNLIAEMILGYADMLLSEAIDKAGISNYHILRYRDDYRIFTSTPNDAEVIAKLLTEVLLGLNFRLNSSKTFITDNIIEGSIKADKLYWNAAKKGEKTLQKSLLLIYTLAKKYPNSGSMSTALSDFYKRLSRIKKCDSENIDVLVSIVVDIANKNPRTYPIASAILSKLFSIKKSTSEEIEDSIEMIEKKFQAIPNVGHLMVWLQRLTLKINLGKEYEEKLCKKIIDPNIPIWNIDWVDNAEIKEIVNSTPIINNDYIKDMDPIISRPEVLLFDRGDEYLK
jgi:hypothetical protein